MQSGSNIVKKGGIVVLPTDTLYGICGSALQPKVVEKIYKLRKRDSKKPLIVLVSSLVQLKKFGVVLTPAVKKLLTKVWPGKVSVILPVTSAKFKYLHRGTKTVAFRLPDSQQLIKLLRKTGPLVAPSANPQGEEPAITIADAMEYFADKVEGYIDGGALKSKPSTLVAIKDEKFVVIRPGAVKI